MKIVVALDKFKGRLTATRACEIVHNTLLSVRPELRVVMKPMADGGEGTAEVFRSALGGEWVQHKVTGPLPRTLVSARYLWLPQERLAVVEMSQASGLVLLKPEQRNPLRTHTHGTGELLCYAASRGAQRILLAVGGSATVDGGVGAARAGGWRFVGANGQQVELGGGELQRILKIEDPKSDTELDKEDFLSFSVEVLCDVNNPLCGEHGAAHEFGPQKGATPEMVQQLDAGLRHLAELVKAQLGKDVADVPGAGAAGGLAFGALAFMDAKLIPGVEAVSEAIGLDAELADADWVITGEGRFDEQSLRGKVVSGIINHARRYGVKVAVIAGSVQVPESLWRREGIEVALSTMKPGMQVDEAMASADRLLESAARQLAARLGRFAKPAV
jgi:glycerate 2-kinase